MALPRCAAVFTKLSHFQPVHFRNQCRNWLFSSLRCWGWKVLGIRGKRGTAEACQDRSFAETAEGADAESRRGAGTPSVQLGTRDSQAHA